MGVNANKLIAKTVMKVKKPMHIVLFILNIIFPGLGTCISACIGTGLTGSEKFNCTTFVVGIC